MLIAPDASSAARFAGSREDAQFSGRVVLVDAAAVAEVPEGWVHIPRGTEPDAAAVESMSEDERLFAAAWLRDIGHGDIPEGDDRQGDAAN